MDTTKPKTFIFIGRSGCGKGTQAKLLQRRLKELDPKRESLYIQSGQEFRDFIQGTTTTQQLCRDLYSKGELQPEFLAIFMWVNVLVTKYTKDEHLIMDGMPRKFHEAGVLDSIFGFYKLEKPHVIYIDISKEESVNRLLARKRIDDTREEIEERLAWFETDVVPTLEFYRTNPDYKYIIINGEQPIDLVSNEILSKIQQ